MLDQVKAFELTPFREVAEVDFFGESFAAVAFRKPSTDPLPIIFPFSKTKLNFNCNACFN